MRVSFTDRELDVMAVLWDRGSATVAEVRERIPDELAYTTVLTVLRTLDQMNGSVALGFSSEDQLLGALVIRDERLREA